MNLELHESCYTCPATLVCRMGGSLFSHTCPECRKPWLVVSPRVPLGYVFVIRFPKFRCGDHQLSWILDHTCPFCRFADTQGYSRWILDIPFGRPYRIIPMDLTKPPSKSDPE